MKMTTVPASKVNECWDILHRAHAIWQQAYDEGIPLVNTEWSNTYDEVNKIDNYLWQNYGTPCCFFRDTINQAIACEMTYQEYLVTLKTYGIEVI